MGSITDIQSVLEDDFRRLSERGADLREFFGVIWKATKQLGVQSEAGERAQEFLSAAVLVKAYDAFVALNDGSACKASWLVIRSWQDAVRANREHSNSVLDAQKLLEYHEDVSDFLDAEVRFSWK
jgi:hypothetical protein